MKLLIILIILLITIVNGCKENWECGNNPSSLCKKNVILNVDSGRNSRIVLDKMNKRVLVSARYTDEIESRILSISMDKGSSEQVVTLSTLFGAKNGDLNGLLWVHPKNGNLLMCDGSMLPDNHKSARLYYPKTNEYGPIVDTKSLNTAYQYLFPKVNAGSFTYDETNKLIYMCSVYERGVRSLTLDLQPYKGDNGLTTTGICEQVKKSGDAFYFLSYSDQGDMGVIYSNVSFNPGKTPVWSHYASHDIFIQEKTIKDFDVSSTHLYYSNIVDGKLYEIPISANAKNGVGKRVILNEFPLSFEYYQGFIYYSNGKTISKISIIPNSKPIVLFDSSSTASGSCVCAQGYTGKDCNQCDTSKNLISWTIGGSPRCLPFIKGTTQVVTCDYDYQCNSNNNSICKKSNFNYKTCSPK